MKLYTVTITGADDQTNPEDLVALTEKYPFVEWGILLSAKREGSERYPTVEWIEGLRSHRNQLRLSGHLCGRWVRELKQGHLTFRTERPTIWGMFRRIQLNMGGKYEVELNNFLDAVSLLHDKQIILQVNSMQNELLAQALKARVNTVPLFDLSGGRGESPGSWPEPANCERCGYAGGLGPENLEEQLKSISEAVGDREIWVDMESNVRTENVLDLNKVERCLQIAEEYVIPESRAATYLEIPSSQRKVHDSFPPPPTNGSSKRNS